MKRAEKMHDSLTCGECSNGATSFSGREDYDHTATLLLIARRRATKRVTKKTTVVISALRFLNVPVTAQIPRKWQETGSQKGDRQSRWAGSRLLGGRSVGAAHGRRHLDFLI